MANPCLFKAPWDTTAHTALGNSVLIHQGPSCLCFHSGKPYLSLSSPSSMTISSLMSFLPLLCYPPIAPSTKTYVMALAIMLDCHCSGPTQEVIFWGPGANWVDTDSADIYWPPIKGKALDQS